MWKSTMAAALLCAGFVYGQADTRWRQLQFLIGKWKAETGAFSFAPELNGQVLVRRSVNNTPGQKHEDLMIVYEEGGPKAIYFDGEGHVIRYAVTFPAKDTAIFDSTGGGPKYRLSYALEGSKLHGEFQIDGKTYLKWTTARE